MAITASVLPLLMERIGGVWPDNQNNADLEANVEVLNAIAANQTSSISEIIGNEKDRDVKVVWVKACPPTPVDCADSCTFAGTEAATDSKTYALTVCKQDEFKVDIDGFYNNEFEATDAAARLMMASFVGFAQQAAMIAVGRLNTFAGTHLYTAGGAWTANGTTMEVPANLWTSAFFGYLRTAGIKNKLLNPYLISGELLFQEFFMWQTSMQNGEGKGDANRMNTMKVWFDLFNVDTVNSPDLVAYEIAKGALAFASKAYYDTRPEHIEGRDAHTRWSVSNPFFPMQKIDIQKTTSCSAGHTYEHYKMKSKYDIFNNPLGCVAGTTGVLKFSQVAGV